MNANSQRCINKVLPFSKYCYVHILNDPDQYLYISCVNQKNKNFTEQCPNPVEGFLKKTACRNHNLFLSNDTDQAWQKYKMAKKLKGKKRKKKDDIKEVVTKRRFSGRKKEEERRSFEMPTNSTISLKTSPVEFLPKDDCKKMSEPVSNVSFVSSL